MARLWYGDGRGRSSCSRTRDAVGGEVGRVFAPILDAFGIWTIWDDCTSTPLLRHDPVLHKNPSQEIVSTSETVQVADAKTEFVILHSTIGRSKSTKDAWKT